MRLPHFQRRVRNFPYKWATWFAESARWFNHRVDGIRNAVRHTFASQEASVNNVFRRIAMTAVAGLVVFASFTAQAADNKVSHEVYLERANSLIRSYQHFPAVMALQQAIRLADDQYPSIYMRLAILYYGLGMIPDAIAAGEKAVALAPQTKWYKFDLAKFYLVDKRYPQAKEQLLALLQIDPGFTLGYVYLGEVYLALGQKSMAWACLRWADQLGRDGDLLRQKLQIAGGRPPAGSETLVSGQPGYFRFIKVESRKDADAVLKQITDGKSFENLEMELQNTKSIHADFGLITAPELDQNVAGQLATVKVFAPPVVVRTGSDYRVMQKILPFDRAAWARLETSAGITPTAIAAASPPAPLPPPAKIAVSGQTEVVSSISSMPGATVSAQAERPEPQQIATATAPPPPPAVATAPQPPPAVATVPQPPPAVATVPQPPPAVATVPQPSPAVVEEKAAPVAAETSVALAIETWRAHWQKADAGAYLACYSPSFVPAKGMSRDHWRAGRVKTLSLPSSMMEITLSNIRITMQGTNQATATFQQDYASDRLRDSVIKTLSLRRENGEWKITKELVDKEL